MPYLFFAPPGLWLMWRRGDGRRWRLLRLINTGTSPWSQDNGNSAWRVCGQALGLYFTVTHHWMGGDLWWALLSVFTKVDSETLRSLPQSHTARIRIWTQTSRLQRIPFLLRASSLSVKMESSPKKGISPKTEPWGLLTGGKSFFELFSSFP